MSFVRDNEALVIFMGKKQSSPEAVNRWVEKLIAATKPLKKPPEIKTIWQRYKIRKELTAKEALALKKFYDEEMGRE